MRLLLCSFLRLLPVNYELISPTLTHVVLRVTLLPSVPSTHRSHHPSSLHFHSTLSLKTSFRGLLQILPTVVLFLLHED